MSVSTLILSTVAPSSVADTWALAYLFKTNWQTTSSTHSSFSTSVSRSMSAGEVRRGQLAVPKITGSGLLVATNKSEVNRLISTIKRMGKCRSLFPLYSDQSELTAAATVGSSTISCDTSNRRLFVGKRIVVASRSDRPGILVFDVRQIASMTFSAITLDAPLTHAFAIHDFVLPLFEARLFFSMKGTVVTDTVAQVAVDAVECTGDTQLGAVTAPGTLPDGFSTYNDLPILEIEPDFAQSIALSITRYGQLATIGLDSIPTVYGDRSVESFTLPMTCADREEAFSLISFFHSRGGKLFPFYAISPLTEFTAASDVSGSFDSIDIVAEGEELDWSFRPLIGFALKDGTVAVSEISDVIRTGNVDTVSFEAVTGLTMAQVSRVTTARLCRFDSDDLVETWQTTGAMQATLEAVELLAEQDITTGNLTLLGSTDLTVTTGITCIDGLTAGATYYEAFLCDGITSGNHSLMNVGQSLPYEFKIVDDPSGNICYRIPPGAPTLHVPIGTIPDAIIQEPCCSGGGGGGGCLYPTVTIDFDIYNPVLDPDTGEDTGEEVFVEHRTIVLYLADPDDCSQYYEGDPDVDHGGEEMSLGGSGGGWGGGYQTGGELGLVGTCTYGKSSGVSVFGAYPDAGYPDWIRMRNIIVS